MYQELIKDFSRLRAYMQDFFVYGFHTRKDIPARQMRTYDDERRRIESYLGEFVHAEYGLDGKQISLSLRTDRLRANPFYAAYASKSFTDNDLCLHFYLLELLQDGRLHTIRELADALLQHWERVFEEQTLRLKLKEYAAMGILAVGRQGRAAAFSLSPLRLEQLLPKARQAALLGFFSEAAPFGEIGGYLLQAAGERNSCFVFRHHFIAPVLDDMILLTILAAMRQGRYVTVVNFSHTKQLRSFTGAPLRILVSRQNGRRYVLLRGIHESQVSSFRLDYIRQVKLGAPCPELGEWQRDAAAIQAWGPTYTGGSSLETVRLVLEAGADEAFILTRLQRERRHGQVRQIGPGRYEYRAEVPAVREILGWVKSFIGRIVVFESSDERATAMFYADLHRLQELYASTTPACGGEMR